MTDYIPLSEARHYLQQRTGIKPDRSVLYHAVRDHHIDTKQQKRDIPIRGKYEEVTFSIADLDAFADKFLMARKNHIDIQQAFELFNAHTQSRKVSIEEFMRLIKSQNVPSVAAHIWYIDFFVSQQVIETAQGMTNERLEELLSHPGLLTVREAIRKLHSKAYNNPIKENTLFLFIKKGIVTPAVKPPDGFREGYRFSEEQLKDIPMPRDYEAIHYHTDVPVVDTTAQIKEIEQEHGELITSEKAVSILRTKIGGTINEATARQRLRKHAVPVARFGSLLLYPKRNVDEMVTRPLAAKRGKQFSKVS